MKTLFYLFMSFLYLLILGCDDGGYRINGSVSVPDGTKVYLVKKGRPIIGKYNDIFDSTSVVSNSFHFIGNVDDPNFYSIELENYRGFLPFFLESESYSFELKADSIWKGLITSNSTDYNLSKSLNSKLKPIIKKINKAYKSRAKFKAVKDSVNAELSLKENQNAARERDLTLLDFIKDNPSSYISLLRFPLSSRHLEKDEKIKAFNYLSKDFEDHPRYKQIKYELFDLDRIMSEGNVIPDLQLKNENMEEDSISNFSDKFMLIDIWASWCGPCIKKIPELKEMAAKYPNSLEVIMISIDDSDKLWLDAIEKHNLNMFPNFIENNGQTENLLGIKAIPYKILLQGKGVIHTLKPTIQQVDSIMNKAANDQI